MHLIHRGKSRDLHAFADAAAGAKIRLCIVKRARSQPRLKAKACELALATRDGNGHVALHLEIAIDVER
jgi:hypothetical protein